MSDRAQAIEILKQVRDRLARQLMEQVLEAPDEILEEADGVSYGGRIETIYEHFGARLANVSSMMGQLQMLDDDVQDDTASSSASWNDSAATDGYEAAATVADTMTPLEKTPSNDTSSISGEGPSSHLNSSATWEMFVEHVRQHDRPAAVRVLGELFEIEVPRAERCVTRFADLCNDDPSMFVRALGMRPRLRAATINDALAMLWRLFGLQGPEAVGVYQALRVNIERPTVETESYE